MTLLDIAKTAGLFGGVLLFFTALILGAMWIEQRRQARAAARLAAGLGTARSSSAAGPGRWSLTAVDGTRAGCAVSLRPHVSDATIQVGTSRMKTMAVRLAIRGTRDVGKGTLEVRGRELVITGSLAPVESAVERALIACRAALEIDGAEASVVHALPVSSSTVDRMLETIDAIAPYLAPPDSQS